MRELFLNSELVLNNNIFIFDILSILMGRVDIFMLKGRFRDKVYKVV